MFDINKSTADMPAHEVEQSVNLAEMYSAVQIDRMRELLMIAGAKPSSPSLIILTVAYQFTRNLGL